MSTELLPGKHLFVDDFRIQEMHAARRVLHQPEKPWEKVSLHAGRLRLRRGAGMLPSLVHLRVATVIGTRVLVRDNPPKEFREYQICYAESAGGVHWERPHLGITAGRPTGRRARSAGGTATTSSTGAGTGRPGEPPRRHPRPGVLLPAGSGANQTWAGPLPRHARRLPGHLRRKYDPARNDGVTDCQLAWSRDSVRWERWPEPFIPHGEPGSFDRASVYCEYPAIRGDPIYSVHEKGPGRSPPRPFERPAPPRFTAVTPLCGRPTGSQGKGKHFPLSRDSKAAVQSFRLPSKLTSYLSSSI